MLDCCSDHLEVVRELHLHDVLRFFYEGDDSRFEYVVEAFLSYWLMARFAEQS